MQYLNNPFDTLKATPRDRRNRLASLVADAELLLGNAQQANNAYIALLNPEARLKAEISWVPAQENLQEPGLENFSRLRRTVLYSPYDAEVVRSIVQLCDAYGKIDAGSVAEWINQAREEAGFQPASEAEVIAALGEYARKTAQSLFAKAGGERNLERFCSVVRKLADCCVQKKDTAFPFNQLVQEVANVYELNSAAKESSLREEISRLSRIIQDENRKVLNPRDADELIRCVRDWYEVAGPLRTIREYAGRRNAQYNQCFYDAHNALVDVINRYRDHEKAYWLGNAIKRCFEESTEVSEQALRIFESASKFHQTMEEQREKTRAQAIQSLVSLVAILLIAFVIGAFSNGDEKKKTNYHYNSSVDFDLIRKQQQAVENHNDAMAALLRLQLASLEKKLEKMKPQMEEALEAYRQNPSGVKLALYQKLQQTYAEMEEQSRQTRENIKFYTDQSSPDDFVKQILFGQT